MRWAAWRSGSGVASSLAASSEDAAAGIAHGDVVFIAVGTPPDEDGSADLTYVLAVARSIGQHLARPAVVVDKSTVPVGTADKVRAAIASGAQDHTTAVEITVLAHFPSPTADLH